MEPMERIRQLLENPAGISADELAEVIGLIDEQFDALAEQEPSADVAALLDELVTHRQACAEETTRRETEAAELAQRKDDALARMKNLREPAAETPEAGEEEAKPEDPKGREDPEARPKEDEAPAPVGAEDGAGEGEPLPIAAGAPRGTPGGTDPMPVRMARANGHAEPSPTAGGGNPRRAATVVAAAGLGLVDGEYIGPNTPFRDSGQLARAMSEKLITLKATHDTSKVVVASAMWEYPDDRRLGENVEENTRKVDAVCGLGAGRYDRNGVLVATGGICLPVNVDYSVPTWSTADRPLRDALPSFQATRGGIQYVTPPDIGTSSLETGGPTGAGIATGVWTEATDASPGANTKPVWTVACGAVQTSYVDAIPTRVKFGNMLSRFAPEQVAANTQQAIAAAARTAELNLLSRMFAASKQVIPKQYLGATRDLLASADLLVEQYRYSHRIPDSTAMTAVFPAWAKALVRADLARELAHDNTNGRDVLGISDAQIQDWFRIRGINLVWTMEGLAAGTYGTGGQAIPSQAFAVATAGGQPQWPGQTADGNVVVAWLLFVEGTFQFLDGGRLDLGVVRDSILDATNDYETFVEPFEGIAFRGLEVYQVQSTVLPNGGSAGSVAVSGYHE